MTDLRAQLAPTRASGSAGSGAALPGFGPDDPFISLAYAVLRREAAALAAATPRVPSAPTPGEIHRLRVAARRLRVALRLFRRVLPRADVRRYRDELKWFARSLGDVRDLDVYMQRFDAYVKTLAPARRRELGGYQLYLRRERKAARRAAAEAAASARAAALFRDLAQFVAAGPAPAAVRAGASLTARDAIRQTLRRSVARVRRFGNELTTRAKPAELHELRIRTKRLRYELEFFSTVYPALDETAGACKALQDVLGAHQDAYTATARLRRYAALRRERDGAALEPALLELRRNQLALARRLRRSFRAAWPSFVAAAGAAPKLVA